MTLALEALVDVAASLLSCGIWELVRDPLLGTGLTSDSRTRFDEAVAEGLRFLKPMLEGVPADRQETVATFLASAEVRTLVAQTYRTQFLTPSKSVIELRQGLATIWGAQHAELGKAISAYDLFDALLVGTRHVLAAAIDEGCLSAHEAMSAARHSDLDRRLDMLHRQLTLLSSVSKPDLLAIDRFERSLRDAVGEAHRLLAPPAVVKGVREVPMNELYVDPSFLLPRQDQPVQLEDMVPQIHRLVVLGHPGAGKSTFARKLCLDLANERIALAGGGKPVALFVELRNYVRAVEREPIGIRDYLAALTKTAYSLDVPGHAFEYLLRAGRVAVIFDGLDELPVVARRRDIRQAIQAFSTAYPFAAMVVTSRLVGYEHAALDERSFSVVRLTDFDEQQVAAYAQRWFSIDRHGADAEAGTKAEAFLAESQTVPDLRANPLMLGLMCVIYRGQGYIPRNRPEVYDQCATLLFDTWDRHRGIDALRPFEDLLRPAMRQLAFWIHTTPALQDGVTFDAAVRKTTKFLVDQRYSDPLRAESAARSFIDFCRGRAWVFSDIGADGSDRDVFQFTHRTFLEFFAAEQLLDSCETTDQLIGQLRPKALAGEWDVVAQLATHMQQRRHLNSADRILVSMLSGRLTNVDRQNAVAFAVHALNGLALRPDTVERVARMCLEQVADTHLALSKTRSESALEKARARWQRALDSLADLFRCDTENRDVVLACWRQELERLLDSDIGAIRRLGSEQCVYACLFARQRLALGVPEQRRWWQDALEAAGEQQAERLRSLAVDDRAIAFDAYTAGFLQAGQLVEWFGPGVLYEMKNPLAVPIAIESIAERLIASGGVHAEHEQLQELLLRCRPPWVSYGFLYRHLVGWRSPIDLSFAGCGFVLGMMLTAPIAEPTLDGTGNHPSSWPGTRLLPNVDEIAFEETPNLAGLMLTVRAGLEGPEEAAERLQELDGVSPTTASLLTAWMELRVSFGSGRA